MNSKGQSSAAALVKTELLLGLSPFSGEADMLQVSRTLGSHLGKEERKDGAATDLDAELSSVVETVPRAGLGHFLKEGLMMQSPN